MYSINANNGVYWKQVMKRRHFLFGTGAVGVTTAFALKPSLSGSEYSPYFKRLNDEFMMKGPHKPAVFIDLARLDQNINTLQSKINAKANYRIVVKSLPSPPLVNYVMKATGTHRLMLFHLPFVQYVAEHLPKADILLGKPMPVGAVEAFYRKHSRDSQFRPELQLQWLVDTPKRLRQYQQLARELKVNMRINVEIDVGLHRGGLTSTEELVSILDIIDSDSSHLALSGLMGYDPHVVKLPPMLKSAELAFTESQQIYKRYIRVITDRYPEIDMDALCLNGAGSPTLELHSENSVINDVSAGSCLVKPVDFDIPSLADFIPASYIATPVLKKLKGTRIPSVETLSYFFRWWDPNQAQTFFIYGGQWMARYESPAGLQNNGLYGISTNQQIINGSVDVKLNVDDHVFLRPMQSEAVFLQFGNILAVRNGKIEAEWPILRDG